MPARDATASHTAWKWDTVTSRRRYLIGNRVQQVVQVVHEGAVVRRDEHPPARLRGAGSAVGQYQGLAASCHASHEVIARGRHEQIALLRVRTDLGRGVAFDPSIA